MRLVWFLIPPRVQRLRAKLKSQYWTENQYHLDHLVTTLIIIFNSQRSSAHNLCYWIMAPCIMTTWKIKTTLVKRVHTFIFNWKSIALLVIISIIIFVIHCSLKPGMSNIGFIIAEHLVTTLIIISKVHRSSAHSLCCWIMAPWIMTRRKHCQRHYKPKLRLL